MGCLCKSAVPDLFVIRDQFHGRQFFQDQESRGDSFRMIQTHYIFATCLGKKKICTMVRLYVGSFKESLRFLKKEQVQRLKENYAIMERKPSQH